MSNEQTYFPDKPTHPGFSLALDLEFLSLSSAELSERTGITAKHLSNIINGKASITPEVAIKLERATGTKATFWNNLTRNYHASLAQIEEKKRIAIESKNVGEYKEAYQELVKNGILQKYVWTKKNFEQITDVLLSFFAVNSFSAIPNTQISAFRHHDGKINKETVASLIQLGERKAQSITAEPFIYQALRDALPDIKKLSLKEPEEYLPLIEEKLRTLGIILVCVPGFAHTRLQGAVKWISPDKAVLILRTKTQKGTSVTEDKFWFNLFHELGHLLLHSKGDGFIDLDDKIDSDVENEADKFASNQFMPKFNTLVDLDEYKKNDVIRADLAIPVLAKRYGIAPSIVAGMMSYVYQDKQDSVYSVLNGYKKVIADPAYTNYQVI